MYIMLNLKKVDCHIGWLIFPSGLAVMDGELGAEGESGIGTVFRLIVELFSCMGGELSRFEAGSPALDLPLAISMTQAGQGCLAPLTQVIPDPSL